MSFFLFDSWIRLSWLLRSLFTLLFLPCNTWFGQKLLRFFLDLVDVLELSFGGIRCPLLLASIVGREPRKRWEIVIALFSLVKIIQTRSMRFLSFQIFKKRRVILLRVQLNWVHFRNILVALLVERNLLGNIPWNFDWWLQITGSGSGVVWFVS